MRVAAVICALVLWSSSAMASDKGLQAELTGSLVPLVCTTTIARDLEPLVKRLERLAIAKMSQASLAAELSSIDALWRDIARTHAAAIAATAPSGRVMHLDETALRQAAAAAMPALRRRCPRVARTVTTAVLEELLVRRLADQRAATASTPPTPEHADGG
jgi:hypothetical protein